MARHLIQTQDLTNEEVLSIFKRASEDNIFKERKLTKKRFITVFFENSTRTLSSFEIAIKNLGADAIRFDVNISSTSKGESMADTMTNLNAMKPDGIITRHKSAGAPNFLSKLVTCSIINGGDGAHAHPTQALLDLYTIIRHFKKNEDWNHVNEIQGKSIAIIGDIKNSRVANSNIELLKRFGINVILVSPPHFLDSDLELETSYDINEVIDKVDILMSLRTQTERHNSKLYGSLKDYANRFCITKKYIKDRDIIILHPGPVHRNIDIDDEVLNDPRCKVLEQVENGVKIRMAVLEFTQFC